MLCKGLAMKRLKILINKIYKQNFKLFKQPQYAILAPTGQSPKAGIFMLILFKM